MLYYLIKNDIGRNKQHRTKQDAECLRTRQGLFPTKFLATANELGQRKTQLMYYKDILLTENLYKISLNTKNT